MPFLVCLNSKDSYIDYAEIYDILYEDIRVVYGELCIESKTQGQQRDICLTMRIWGKL